MSEINTDVTLKRLVSEFEQWADAHEQINDFGYGKYLETFRSSGRSYPVLVVNSTGFTIEPFYINYNFEFICLDYVKDEKENKTPVNSNTAKILSDLENTMNYSNRWQEFLRLDNPLTGDKVDEFGADKAFGWVMTGTLKVKKRSGICQIEALLPLYDFETGTTIVPSCPAATYKNSDDTFEQEIASGSTYTAPDVTITINGTPNTLPANKDESYTVTGSPAGNTLNGVSLTDIVSGTTKTFDITYADLSPVVITQTSDDATAFVGTVPDIPTPLVIAPFRPLLRTTYPTFYDYDEAWHIANGTFDFTYTAANQIQCLDPLDNEKIFFDDSAVTGITQHKFRFVGQLGGYYNQADSTYYDIDGNVSTYDAEFKTNGTKYYIIDRLTWLGWNGIRGATTNIVTQLATMPATFGSFTDFVIPPMQFLDVTFSNMRTYDTYPTKRPPFNIDFGAASCSFYANTTPPTHAWELSTTYGTVYIVGISTGVVGNYTRVHIWGTDDSI